MALDPGTYVVFRALRCILFLHDPFQCTPGLFHIPPQEPPYSHIAMYLYLNFHSWWRW